MSVLNSPQVQEALKQAILSKHLRCKCKLKGKIEGMSISVNDILDFTKWIDPDSGKEEYLLLLSGMPLVSISENLFQKHFDSI